MEKILAVLLLGALLGISPPLLSAQQSQGIQTSDSDIEVLKQRVSELEKQLQIVANVEKLELQAKLVEAKAKLADANTKIINAEFGKFERELRDSNSRWLRDWGIIFLAFLSVIGVGIWSWLRSRTNQLIADAVVKNLDGFKAALKELDLLKTQQDVLKKEADRVEKSFKEATAQLDILKIQQRILEKELATATLEDYLEGMTPLLHGFIHPERIRRIREEALLDVFGDEGKPLAIRYRAAEVLAARRSPQLVSPMLKFLNSVIDADSDIKLGLRLGGGPFVNLLGEIHTRQTYEALTIFLNRVFGENQKHKDLFLTWTALSLAEVSFKLDIRDSATILRKSVPLLNLCPGAGIRTIEHMESYLSDFVEYFDALDDQETIKTILRDNQKRRQFDGIVNLYKCLRLLQKYDTEFVEKWRAQNLPDKAES